MDSIYQEEEDIFLELYTCGFEIDNTHVDDIENFYAEYKKQILNCLTVEEAIKVSEKFKFLAADAKSVLKTITQEEFEYIKTCMVNGSNPISDHFIPVILPRVMFFSKQISSKFEIPEYLAAIQYVRVNNWPKVA